MISKLESLMGCTAFQVVVSVEVKFIELLL